MRTRRSIYKSPSNKDKEGEEDAETLDTKAAAKNVKAKKQSKIEKIKEAEIDESEAESDVETFVIDTKDAVEDSKAKDKTKSVRIDDESENEESEAENQDEESENDQSDSDAETFVIDTKAAVKDSKAKDSKIDEESENEEVENDQSDSESEDDFVISTQPKKAENESESEDDFVIDSQPSAAKEDETIENDQSESESEENSVISKSVKETETVSEPESDDEFVIDSQPSKEDEKMDENESESEKSSKKRKKPENSRKYPKYNKAIEEGLEKFLFGKTSQVSSDEEEIEEKQKPQWSAIETPSSSEDEDEKIPKKKSKIAWHDEEDEKDQVKDITKTFSKAKGKHGKKEISTENYAQNLRKQFMNLMETPKWADLQRVETEDSDDEFFRETTDTLRQSKSLKKEFLEFRKLKDINYTTHNEGSVIKCAEFHPKNSIGLVAGLNGTASLFEIDGKTNPKIKSVHFENFPVKTAHFTHDGRQFLAGSQHFGHYFTYDLGKDQIVKVPWKEQKSEQFSMQKFEVSPTNDLVAFHGRFGNIHLTSAKTRSKLFTLKMNDDLAALTFSPDGNYLYSHGVGGSVYIWDLKAQECIHKFTDDGCIKGTALAISRNNRYLGEKITLTFYFL